MKKQLLLKLSVFIVTTMMFSATANAQIVYTDVIPDSTILFNSGTKNYNLDLNNDGNNDFTLAANAFVTNVSPYIAGRSIKASPLNGNAVKDTLVNSNTVSIPLQFNAVIDGNLLLNQSWQTSGWNILKDTTKNNSGGLLGYGLWNNLSDYYLGLRLIQLGQTYYGWVRLHVDVSFGYDTLIIRDYAYSKIPNQPILAGQTMTTGIMENSLASSINLFPNPADNHLTIDLGSDSKKVQVTIADITGKVVYTTTVADTQSVEVNTDDLAEGIYVVQIQTGEFIGTKKLVVAK